jgi:hypothetical protein
MYYDGWLQPQVFYFISKIISPILSFLIIMLHRFPSLNAARAQLAPEHHHLENVSHPFFLREFLKEKKESSHTHCNWLMMHGYHTCHTAHYAGRWSLHARKT